MLWTVHCSLHARGARAPKACRSRSRKAAIEEVGAGRAECGDFRLWPTTSRCFVAPCCRTPKLLSGDNRMNQRFRAGQAHTAWRLIPVLCLFVAVFLLSSAFAQETTGGLQGTVKDSTGAVVSKALVELSGTSLVGTKSVETDGSGYFRIANLLP